MPRPARFTIRAASALTGINQNTLRAWERRHGLIRPERTPKGYRLYSDDDIQRLRLIQRAIQEGVSVGRVRDYLESDGTVERLMNGTNGASSATATVERSGRLVEVSLADAGLHGSTTIRIPAETRERDAEPLASFSLQIESATLRLDRTTVERTFQRAVGLYSLRQAFYHALVPALTRVLERSGDAADGCGAMLAGFAREKLLVALAGLRPLHQQPRALFGAVPGDRAEPGLMLTSLETGLEGVSAFYLAAESTIEDIVRAADAAGSRIVVLSATRSLPRETLLGLRDALAGLRRRPRLAIGGPAAQKEQAWLRESRIELLPRDAEEARTHVLRAIG